MADEATTAASPGAPAPIATTESTTSVPTNGDAAASTKTTEHAQASADHAKLDETTADSVNANGDDAASAEPSADGTPAAGKDKKRKSLGGVPEHKNKKLNKKKSMLTLRLDCKPGQFYWARLKGYPPWPSVICDEEMLPESLLATRPVSTARPDGSIRDDFNEGGKNAKERTFPIMFLSTNEFQWMVNTNLTPLDPEECKTLPSSKMTKALQDAYKIASENHDIDHFKTILRHWQEEEDTIRQAEEEAAAEAERAAAEQAAKAAQDAKEEKEKPKKKARKSKGANEDVDMDGVEAPKSSKKRKNDVESDAEAKPKKTPKVMKLNAPKTPSSEASSTKKPKKKVVTAPKMEEQDDSKPQMTEAEKQTQREKAVLYLRHRLQKGFLSRDQMPQESEMAAMADFFTQLENYENLEPSIIRVTKIHKVLKAVVKLASIPKEEEYNFKKRSAALLEVWNKRMEAEADTVPQSATEANSAPPATNGEQEPKDVEMKESTLEDAQEDAEKESEAQAEAKAMDSADGIEAKVEGKPEAVAGPPPEEAAEKANGDVKDAEPATATA